jgi:non-lysosomal glucosylceramidase
MPKTTNTYPHTATAAAFPLGGIGTGNVSLGARGELRDWEIFNRPHKGGPLPNTFFALRVQAGVGEPVTRVLEAPIQPPHNASHGYHPWSNAGLPRLAGATLRGEYPLATLQFSDPDLPVSVELRAFTPFIPLEAEDSGLPCAVLTYQVTNPTQENVSLTLVGSFINPVGGIAMDRFGNLTGGKDSPSGNSLNEYRQEGELHGLFLRSASLEPGDVRYGDLSVVALHPSVTYKRAWLRGDWFDFLQEFWDDLSSDGQLTDLGYSDPSPAGRPDTASLGVTDTLTPGESKPYTFLLCWHFPNRRDSWEDKADKPIVRTHYAARFSDSWAVARYVAANLPRLSAETQRFHDALFDSTLPDAVIEALSANLVPLRSTTCFWLEDGRFFGWEGCFDDAGCCAGSCTHVWSYAYTLAYLFPSLEREMRHIEFTVETRQDGYMYFRTFQTSGDLWVWGSDTPAAADGQMGSVLRVYREWQLSGDRAWLAQVWPGVKRAIAFAAAHWDTDGDGVLDGRQHNTYDIEFYGPNPLCSLYYLAGLRAVEELAGVMNEPDLAQRCREVFQRGRQNLDELTWNGEYFIQSLPDVDAHRYQHGEGCLSDQLLGQLHAHLLGLGDLLLPGRARAALQSIYNYNFKTNFRDHVNCQRTYVLNDEAGLILCSWPHGGRPRFPFPYSDEVWTGIEYHVAAHLIGEGLVSQGLEIVTAARVRHDGFRRNPWDEVECGHHYARSMSSWALLLAASGMHCDPLQKTVSFEPVQGASTEADRFQCFWSDGLAWGTYTQRRDPATGTWQPSLQVLGGALQKERLQSCGGEWTLTPEGL